MRLDIMRHGKTRANDHRLYCGWTELPLTLAGREEILALCKQGIYNEAVRFFTSGTLRAAETLRLIYGDIPYQELPDFREYNFGRFEMKNYEDLREDPDYQAWITDKTGEFTCPGGESRRVFHSRVLDGFSKLLAELAEDRIQSACLVCHGGTVAEIMAYIRPGENNFYEWQPEYGRGYSMHLENGVVRDYRKI